MINTLVVGESVEQCDGLGSPKRLVRLPRNRMGKTHKGSQFVCIGANESGSIFADYRTFTKTTAAE